MMKQLREDCKACKGERTVDGVTLQLMSPADKRNLITKVVAECHKRVLQSISCKCTFHATETWL